jgi:hypothetical protein
MERPSEPGNGEIEKSEKDVAVRAKAERDVVDELPGEPEVEDDVVESVNVDKELGVVVEACGIRNNELVDEGVDDGRINIVEAVKIAGACEIVKAANKVLAGKVEEHNEVLVADVLVTLVGGRSPMLDGGGLAEINEDKVLDVVDKVVDFDEAVGENVEHRSRGSNCPCAGCQRRSR